MFLVLGDCGDYYCDEEHPLGLFETEAEAKAAMVASPVVRYGPDGIHSVSVRSVLEIPVGRIAAFDQI